MWEWVRGVLRTVRGDRADGDVARKLAAVRAAATYDFPTADIEIMNTEIERGVANAELSVAMSEAANRMSFADRLAAEGVTTVTLDAEGNLVERGPEGHDRPLKRLDLVVGLD